ncbi:unnamed protein product [Euphydryas editha]|uniref:Brain and acute leukemia cytoplasmic protein n=1 Tax=Euphydryas editha TaxID=104508 RepID=A0AAU9TS59_EUPED|nr:unnamed protein product [Euphydryas editha]
MKGCMVDGRFGQSVSLRAWNRKRKLHYPRRVPAPQASENPATLRRAAPSNLGGGNLRFCASPITGVDAVPEKGGDTTSTTTTLATNSDCRRTERTLPLRDSKGRFIKGGKEKTGSIGRETPIPDSGINTAENALSAQPTVVLTRIDDAGSHTASRRSSVS